MSDSQRGRPKMYDTSMLDVGEMADRSRRTKINLQLAMRSVLRLRRVLGLPTGLAHVEEMLPEPFCWLQRPRVRITVLVELGRISRDAMGDDAWLDLVRQCCESKLTTREIAGVVRRLRLGSDKVYQGRADSAQVLVAALEGFIRERRLSYDMSKSEAEWALDYVLQEVESGLPSIGGPWE